MTDVIVYIEGETPTEAEKAGIGRLVRSNYAVTVRRADTWKIEPCDAIVTRRKEIGDAYAKHGVSVLRDGDVDAMPGPQRVLSDRIYKLLVGAGFESATAIQNASDKDLLAIDGIGPKSLKEIRQVPW